MRYQIREKIFAIGEDSDITNEQGQPVYHVDGKIFSLHNTLIIRDLSGQEVAKVQRQLIALTPTYHITAHGQEIAELRKKLFSPFIDRFTIDVPGPDDLNMTGDLFSHEYTITRGGKVVATVSKKWISLTDTYGVETAPGENDLVILASVLALDVAKDIDHEHSH
jgi:uncharacterized protein YxjI